MPLSLPPVSITQDQGPKHSEVAPSSPPAPFFCFLLSRGVWVISIQLPGCLGHCAHSPRKQSES